MRDRHKKMCGTPKNAKSKKSMWSKAAQKAAGSRLYNSVDAPHYAWTVDEGPDDNLVVLIRDITSKMIGAIKKKDQRKLIGLYKTLGKIVGD